VKGGKAGISRGGMLWKICSDVVFPGKMLMECYLAEDSRCATRREKRRKRMLW
jgi:hypothetical protein